MFTSKFTLGLVLIQVKKNTMGIASWLNYGCPKGKDFTAEEWVVELETFQKNKINKVVFLIFLQVEFHFQVEER